MPNPIALAIPFFFLLIGVELWVAARRGLKLYRFADVIADLSCGMTQQLFLVFEVAALTGGYVWLYQNHRLFTFAEGSIWPWVIAFFAVDFVYYWWHRLSHRVNVLWAVHAVHHQSEDYNLAVALRQAVLSVWTIWPFHLPLALAGVPPLVFATVESFSTLYQFWIHTELIGKLGWFERLFNTPSQHRRELALSGPQLRRDAVHLGPPLRHLPGGAGGAGLRAVRAAAQLQPSLRAGVLLPGVVAAGGAGAAPFRQAARLGEAAALAAGALAGPAAARGDSRLPAQYGGGGNWEAMQGKKGGIYEVRVDGPGRRQYRLFCSRSSRW